MQTWILIQGNRFLMVFPLHCDCFLLVYVRCVCMCVHAGLCAWRSEISVRWLLSHSSHKFLRQGLPLSLLLTNLDRLAGQQATWSLLFLLLQRRNHWHSLPHLMFLHGCWDLNSRSHACAASTFTN